LTFFPLLNKVTFVKVKFNDINRFESFIDPEYIFLKGKFGASKLNNLVKNASKICIKLCAASIFGCRIRNCSI